MNKSLIVVGLGMLVAACSAVSPELGLPSVSMAANLYNPTTESDEAYFIVNVGRVPLILNADFAPE
jgi:hypothetical protein